MVVSEARESPTHPDEEKQHRRDFHDERQQRKHRANPSPRFGIGNARQRIPSAEEKHYEKRRAQHHMSVFAHEEQPELEAAVFRVVAADEVGFAFRHIERKPVRFREERDEEQKSRKRLLR